MDKLTLLAVGDISLNTNNNAEPFALIKQSLSPKDILIGNLETSILSHPNNTEEKAVSLETTPDSIKYLKGAGFDIVSIANNHVLDNGANGFHKLLETLEGMGIEFIGGKTDKNDDAHRIISKGNISAGFLSYYEYGQNYEKDGIVINRIDDDIIKQEIDSLRSKCDVLIVSMHWGIELVMYPSPTQIKIARQIIEWGADAVIGHHPHVMQGVEQYKNGFIAYSLGNFQFQTSFDHPLENTDRSFILKMEYDKNGYAGHGIIPIKINENYQPVLADDKEEKEQIKKLLDDVSRPILGNTISESWWFEQAGAVYLKENYRSFKKRVRKYGMAHRLKMWKWLVSPFVVKCCLGWMRTKLKGTRTSV